jgi:hypothetical protein
MRQRTRSFEWVVTVAASGLASIGLSAPAKPALTSVEAVIRFPGEARTAAVVYAREIGTGAVTATRVQAGESKLAIKLAPGRYWLFAEPDDPGAPDLFGAYTEWSRCHAAPHVENAPPCESHALAEVLVERASIGGLGIDDWYLPAVIVRQLDEALRRNPDRPDDLELGAPRFSEYSVRVETPGAAFRFDPASHPEAGKWESAIRGVAAHGINFAGHWLVVGINCGEHCTSYALVEWSSSRIFAPDALRAVAGGLPCERAQSVQHRADSRLLTVIQPDDRSVVARYYLWDEARGSLSEIASYRSSAQRYCGRD